LLKYLFEEGIEFLGEARDAKRDAQRDAKKHKVVFGGIVQE
jgi:hypothetical protein